MEKLKRKIQCVVFEKLKHTKELAYEGIVGYMGYGFPPLKDGICDTCQKNEIPSAFHICSVSPLAITFSVKKFLKKLNFR